jgi:hypothetical protein
MKTNGASLLRLGFLMSLCLGGLLVIVPQVFAAGDSPGEARLEEIEDLERQAQKLKGDGHHEEAQEIMRKVDRIRAQNDARNVKTRIEPGNQDSRRYALKSKLTESQRELKQLRKAGRKDEAVIMEQHVDQLERELRRLQPQDNFQARPDQPQTDFRQPRMDLSPSGDAERRFHHLAIAIESLHAAGMHDPAVRLTREADKLKREMEMRRSASPREPGGDPYRGELNGLRQELRELRQSIQELRAQMEQLKRER